MAGPLDGVTVLDFTRLLPGPFATQLLGNLGADVIKIEDPRVGDYMRSVPPTKGGLSYPFLMVNRGKRSVAVDLKMPRGQEIVRRLAARADILVEQFRPGVMERLGADHASLSRVNPRLVYVSFSGYGQTGPDRDRAGHDITFQAHAGILGVTGDRDGRPVVPGVPIADLASGYNAALAILAALRARDRTGKGDYVDVSIFDTAVSLMVLNFAHHLATGEEPSPGETILTGTFPFYDVYETKDGRWLAIGAVEPKFWTRLCEILGVPDLSGDQFGDPASRVRTGRALARAIRARIASDLEAIGRREGLPIALVRRTSEVVADPQLVARGLLPAVGHIGSEVVPVVAHPAHHATSQVREPGTAPALGEHTREVLAWLGYGAAEIEALAAADIISG